MSIGDKIKQKRLELKLTQEELGNMVGYTSKTTLSKIEAGLVDLPESKIILFAKALQTTPAYLMGWETPNKQPMHSLQLTDDEQQLVIKYRCLDVRGKYAVDTTLDREYEFYIFAQHNSVSGY